jgi:hypothetical protein
VRLAVGVDWPSLHGHCLEVSPKNGFFFLCRDGWQYSAPFIAVCTCSCNCVVAQFTKCGQTLIWCAGLVAPAWHLSISHVRSNMILVGLTVNGITAMLTVLHAAAACPPSSLKLLQN